VEPEVPVDVDPDPAAEEVVEVPPVVVPVADVVPPVVGVPAAVVVPV
jgi:hypothetical protein